MPGARQMISRLAVCGVVSILFAGDAAAQEGTPPPEQQDTLAPEPGAPPEPAPVKAPPPPEVATPPPEQVSPLPPPPPPPPVVVVPPPDTPWRVGGSVGIGVAFAGGASQTYVIIAALVGYELVEGLEANLGGSFWAGSPVVGKIAPGFTYYAPIPLHPYLGVYYARWFIEGSPGENALGVRGGLISGEGPVLVGVGIAFEHILNCTAGCDSFWPDVSAGVRF